MYKKIILILFLVLSLSIRIQAEQLKLGEIAVIDYSSMEIKENKKIILNNITLKTDVESLNKVNFNDKDGVQYVFNYGFGKVYYIGMYQDIFASKKVIHEYTEKYLKDLMEKGWVIADKEITKLDSLKIYKHLYTKDDYIYGFTINSNNSISSINTKITLQKEMVEKENYLKDNRIDTVLKNTFKYVQ